jgi:nucleoid-associated protein YgaU
MGLFDFVKEAGDKLWGDDEPEVQEAVQVSEERLNEVKAERIAKKIGEAGIKIAGLDVSVSGDTATLCGTAHSQADCEKATLCAGNQHGIASVDCQLVVEAAEEEGRFYTVQSGDSLSKIAKEFYGDAMKYPQIFEANKPMLSDPDKIYVGQVLRIPAL